MGSESGKPKLHRALDRIQGSAARAKRRKASKATKPVSSASPHVEYSLDDLCKRAHDCPNPIILRDPSAPPGYRILALPCGSWTCPSCGPKRCSEFSQRTLLAISAYIEEQLDASDEPAEVPHEWTLTFRPDDLPGEPRSAEQMAAAREAWNRLRRAVAEGRRRQGLPPLIYT
ncbi:MAG: hypothetical protein ACYS0E_21630, partial [Planctomycetota bacterium]